MINLFLLDLWLCKVINLKQMCLVNIRVARESGESNEPPSPHKSLNDSEE